MFYRRFGRTNLNMPVLSCGGMRYQFKWDDLPMKEIPKENQKNLEKTIQKAVEHGIFHIETARGYGSSERQLGQILSQFPRNKLIVQTKITPTQNSQDFYHHFEESLERLQLDYVDLLGIHGINNDETLDWTIQEMGCLDQARQLQKENKTRFVGFSTHGSTELILKTLKNSNPTEFDYINLHWYYINQKNWPCILRAQELDMGIFIISPTDKGGMLYQPSQKLIQLTAPLHPIEFNDLFCLSHPQIHTLSVGASNPHDFDLHIHALKHLDQATDLLPPIIERMSQALYQAVGKDFAMNFDKNISSWDQTPGQVNIPVILWLYTLLKAYDMQDYAKMRYNLLGEGGHWFPGEQAKEIDSLNLIPSIFHSPFKDQIPPILKQTHDLISGDQIQRLSQQD